MTFSRSRLPVIILGIALLLGSVGYANAQDEPPRLTVWFFRVQAPNPAAKIGFDEWQSLFSNNFATFAKRAASGATYLEGLNFDGADTLTPPNLDIMRRRWREVGALQVIGPVSVQDHGATLISSTIFLGDLQGTLPSDFLDVRQRVITSDYKVTRDSIALVTLYALAMDAERLKRQAAITCGLLSEARTIAADLNLKKLKLEPLGTAINTSLKNNACGARP